MSKSRPCRISRSPNWTRSWRAEMIGAPGTASCMSAEPPGQVEKSRENHIHQDHHQDGNHYGGGGGTPHFLGAGAGGKALLASYSRDDDAEHKAFENAG